jgi:hypothetical protein
VSDRRNALIAALVAAVVVLAVLLARELTRGGAPAAEPSPVDRPSVSVLEVDVDRDRLARVEILFDRPLAEGAIGEVLAEPPASITPHVGGVWSWVATHVLRFTPSAPLAPATRYAFALEPERFVGR